jgi:hypothetical protein
MGIRGARRLGRDRLPALGPSEAGADDGGPPRTRVLSDIRCGTRIRASDEAAPSRAKGRRVRASVRASSRARRAASSCSDRQGVPGSIRAIPYRAGLETTKAPHGARSAVLSDAELVVVMSLQQTPLRLLKGEQIVNSALHQRISREEFVQSHPLAVPFWFDWQPQTRIGLNRLACARFLGDQGVTRVGVA